MGGPSPAARRAEATEGALGEISGFCRGNGTWDVLQSIAITSEEEAKIAEQVWDLFKSKYKKASESGIFIDTPVGPNDVKYRFLRLKKTMSLTPAKAWDLVQVDPMPLVVDSDFVQTTFDAMVRGSDYDTAVEVVFKNPPVLTASESIEDRMEQANIAAGFMTMTRPLNQLLASVFR